MAKIVDKEPKYEGEKKVWNAFSKNLPQHWVVYNNRSVNGREYDFCVIVPDVGVFIIEVKGWHPQGILTVVDENTIILAGAEKPEDSPRGQARGYRFDLLKKIQKELGMNLLVMSLVCYPLISENVYREKGLNIVSETNETIFEEDLLDSSKLYQKFMSRYNVDKGAKHDELDAKRFAILRHYFEPNYDIKADKELLNPGYSRLRVFINEVSDEEISNLLEEYFKGIKEVVFVNCHKDLERIVSGLNSSFESRNLSFDRGDLVIGHKPLNIPVENSFTIFNFQIEVIEDVLGITEQPLLVEEGICTSDDERILMELSSKSSFNYQQYRIEHACSDKNILVAAGAGTGKTHSMVSRIAYLCNKTTDSVVDIVSDIAMVTFTDDAAENMKRRVKKMFMNYFVLTANEKYMHFIEDMSQIQISTIHKFAISMLKNDCMRFGLGYDSQISSETYERRQLYHLYLNDYLKKRSEENPDFIHQLPIATYKLEEILQAFSDKLYDRSFDIKKLKPTDVGGSIAIIPFFNDLIFDVIIPAEKEYAFFLKENNLLSLRDCMIQIHDLVANGKLLKQGHNFKYLFVDEFQDTDDVQIETVADLQALFGEQCRLFVVGDLKQSIYRFRGATLSAFENIAKLTDQNEWQHFSLNRNYRTDRRLLDLFHNVFLNMGDRGVLPYVEENDRLSSLLCKEYSDDDLLRKVEFANDEPDDFFNKLFDEISDQKKKIEELSQIKKLTPEEKTIAVLVRYNYQISNLVRAAESNEELDFRIKVAEGGDLYRLSSTIDLYRLVMAVTHPKNATYLINLLKSNYVGINLDYSKIAGYTPENKLCELTEILDKYFTLHIGKNWNQLVLDFETRPVLVVLREIYEKTKPWGHFVEPDVQREYRENFDCLIEKMTRKFSHEYLTIGKISDFLKINITTHQEAASRKKQDAGEEINIICTTIHKSKGLEYGTVIVPFTGEDITNIDAGGLNVNIENGKITYSLSIHNVADYSTGFDEDIERKEKMCEESRILYVAMTRAIRNFVWLVNADAVPEECWGNYLGVNE